VPLHFNFLRCIVIVVVVVTISPISPFPHDIVERAAQKWQEG
jgi:hypothetical protein